MKKLWILLTLPLFVLACANNDSQTDDQDSEKESQVQKTYTLIPFSASPEYPDAAIESMDYENGAFTFSLSGESYKLGEQTADAPQKMCANSGKGQHIHLIVDNGPYAAKYAAEFDHEVAEGAHFILAFLSRSYHESIKTAKAHTAVKVNIADHMIAESETIEEPMLFYSRPKGTYVGNADTKKVMLDFYLVNVELGEGYQVKADINGEVHMIDQWQPYYIEGLPMGENTITLTLVDAGGNQVEAPLNPVSRTFTLKEDPAE